MYFLLVISAILSGDTSQNNEGFNLPQIELSVATPKLFDIDEKEEVNLSTATLESMPSAVVANCVNALTGTFFDSEIDLTVPGAHPLFVQRTYCSSNENGEWHFSHMPEIHASHSEGGHHLYAFYQDGTGSTVKFIAHKHSNNKIKDDFLQIPESTFQKSLTNCSSGEISGQTNLRNSILFYTKHGNHKFYKLRLGSHVERVFDSYKKDKHHQKGPPTGKLHILQELHPNKNFLSYQYGEHDSIHINAYNSDEKNIGKLVTDKILNRRAWVSSNGQVTYSLEKDRVLASLPTNAIPIKYEYKDGLLCKKNLPEGRFLEIHYNSRNRVRSLKAPVGIDHTPITTHKFSYHEKPMLNQSN